MSHNRFDLPCAAPIIGFVHLLVQALPFLVCRVCASSALDSIVSLYCILVLLFRGGQLFDEVRQVKYLGHWPVALMRAVEWTRNKPGWPSKPVVERALAKRSADGQWQVFGWETTYYYLPRKNNVNIRKFNMDMASFAFRCRWDCEL